MRGSRHPSLRAVVVALVLVVTALAGCGEDEPPSAAGLPAGAFPPDAEQDGASPLAAVEVGLTRVAALGEMATALVSDPERRVLFVASRTGRIHRVPIEAIDGVPAPRSGAPEVVIDLSDAVTIEDERGMFGLELVADGRRVAVSYTGPDGEVTVRLLRLDGTTLVDDVPDPVVLTVPHPFGGHNGGGLARAGDGDLLVALGDMDSRESSAPTAQDPTVVLGGIVRVPAEALGDGARPVPADPSLLVAKGLRNPWRIHVDHEEDDLWIGDVGQETWEEVDVLPSITDHTGVTDFGWPAFEGDEPFNPDVETIAEDPVGPLHTYEHGEGRCAVTLGPRYRGRAVEGLDGAVLFGDFCDPGIRALRPDGDEVEGPEVLGELDGQIAISFDEDAQGEVYVLTDAGDVWRIDPASWRAPDVPTASAPADDGGDDTADGPTATTAPPAAPPTAEECSAVAAILVISRFDDLSPPELERALTDVVAALDAAAGTAPEARRADLLRIRDFFVVMDRLVAPVGYQTSDPGFQQLRDEALTGTGRAEGFPDAVTTVMDAADLCP